MKSCHFLARENVHGILFILFDTFPTASSIAHVVSVRASNKCTYSFMSFLFWSIFWCFFFGKCFQTLLIIIIAIATAHAFQKSIIRVQLKLWIVDNKATLLSRQNVFIARCTSRLIFTANSRAVSRQNASKLFAKGLPFFFLFWTHSILCDAIQWDTIQRLGANYCGFLITCQNPRHVISCHFLSSGIDKF